MEGLQSFIVRMLQASVAMSRLLLTQETKCVLASSRQRKRRTKRFATQKISALYQPLISRVRLLARRIQIHIYRTYCVCSGTFPTFCNYKRLSRLYGYILKRLKLVQFCALMFSHTVLFHVFIANCTSIRRTTLEPSDKTLHIRFSFR